MTQSMYKGQKVKYGTVGTSGYNGYDFFDKMEPSRPFLKSLYPPVHLW